MDLLKVITTKGYILDSIIWSIFANGSLYEDNEIQQRQVGAFLCQRMLNPIEEICKIMRKQAEKFDLNWSIEESANDTKISFHATHRDYPGIRYIWKEIYYQYDLMERAEKENLSVELYKTKIVKPAILEKFHNELGLFLLTGENGYLFQTDSRFNWETQDWILDHVIV